MSKLLIVSFEGMNLDLLTDWIEGGYLPNFERVLKEGHMGELECSRVPYEASGLITAFSGLSESEHGMLSYWQAHNRNYIPETWKSSDVKDIIIWNNDDLKDYKFGIVNIFSTHPVHEINGFSISYAMDIRTIRYAYPPNLVHDLVRKGLPYVQDMGAFFKNQGKTQFISEVNRVEEMRHNVSKELLKQDTDIYIINYTCIDRLCHFYMGELKDDSIPLNDKAVFQMYLSCDSILSDILDISEKNNSDLLLFSSVGFGHLKHFVEINPYLVKKGLLNYGQSDRQPNWKKTVAFESVQGSHGININRKSFYDFGVVEDSDYNSVMYEVINLLKEMPNPYNNNPMFSKVIPGREYYNNNPKVPDIILEPYDWEYLPYGDSYWADIVSRHSQTGWHRNKSVWGGVGPNISGKVREGRFGLINIVSTINQILGKPIKSGLKNISMVR